MRPWRIVLTMCTILACVSLPAQAEPISPESFARFTAVAGFEKSYEQIVSILIANFRQGLVVGFQNSLAKSDAAKEQREKIYPLLNESGENLARALDQTIRSVASFDELMRNVYLPVYRKHFSEEEMRQLIDFYDSPLGRKVANLTPAVMQETSQEFNRQYGQRVQEVGGRLIGEELQRLEAKLKGSR